MIEKDPNGIYQHAPGAKLDSGKIRPTLVFSGFAHALWKVAEVGTYGANKYSAGGWQHVANGEERYSDAMLRHLLKEWMGEEMDPDMDLEHAAAEAWNALAKLELATRAKKRRLASEAGRG